MHNRAVNLRRMALACLARNRHQILQNWKPGIKNCPHSFRQNGSELESQSVQINPLNLPIRQLLSIEGVIECIECIECTQ